MLQRSKKFLARTIGVVAIAVFGGPGCGGPPDSPAASGDVGQVQAEIKLVPTGVQCIKIWRTQATAVGKNFAVAGGQSSLTLDLGILPKGPTSFRGDAFNVACASVTASTVPTWLSETVTADVRPGESTPVALVLKPNLPSKVSVDFAKKVKSLAAGTASTYALMEDGTLRAWGEGRFGQLGNGDSVNHWNWVETVSSGVSFLSLNAGPTTSACARRQGNPNPVCWGNNASGKLIWEGAASYATPQGIAQDATAVAVGASHACVLRPDNTVACQGSNLFGQLGTGSSSVSSAWSNVRAPVTQGVREICAQSNSTCARVNLSVYCWGANNGGQVGNGSTVDSPTPSAVSIGGSVEGASVQIACGWGHACSLRGDGTVWCWGRNSAGEIGDGTLTQRSFPVQVLGITTATQIALAGDHSCALLSDRTVRCWGNGTDGRLGDGSGKQQLSPVTPRGLSGVQAIAAGFSHTCASLQSGGVACWGSNWAGQLGDGTNEPRPLATPVAF